MRVGIIAGEASGDLLAANLIASLKKIYPDLEVEGVAGPNLIEQGCKPLYFMDLLSVMGVIDPLLRLPKLLSMQKWLIKYFLADPPDLFIGVDAPEFNLGVEKALRQAGIPTVHCVSPSVWAWRPGRIHTIKQAVDLLLVLFPFEVEFYQQHNVPVCYIGHPAASKITSKKNNGVFDKASSSIADKNKIIALLPGSRNGELKHMANLYLQVAKRCYQNDRNIKFIIAVINEEHQEYITKLLQNYDNLPIDILVGEAYQAMELADIALVTSGTATLETMLHETPMLVAYRTNWLTYQIGKRLVKVDYIALPNLLAKKAIVPEFIQSAANCDTLAEELLKLLNSAELQAEQVENFAKIHKLLRQDTSSKAVSAIQELLYADCRS